MVRRQQGAVTSARAAVVAGALTVLTACGGANQRTVTAQPGSQPGSALPTVGTNAASWQDAALKPGDPSVLLVNTLQSTSDATSRCFEIYQGSVRSRTHNQISVLLTVTRARPNGCADKAARGPFFVEVPLGSPYSRETIVDASTGQPGQLADSPGNVP